MKLVIIAILALTLISCDNRDLGKPSINVTIPNETLYTNLNNNTTNIYITLTGDEQSVIENQIVDVHYNYDLAGILTNTGDAAFFHTDSFGGANGTLYARSSGSLQIVFSVRGYNDKVKATRLVTIYDPYIYSMQASPTTLVADGATTSVITVRIRPFIYNQSITFTTDLGELLLTSTNTDASGVTTNTITSTEVGRAEVTATLQVAGDIPPATRTIYITFTE